MRIILRRGRDESDFASSKYRSPSGDDKKDNWKDVVISEVVSCVLKEGDAGFAKLKWRDWSNRGLWLEKSGEGCREQAKGQAPKHPRDKGGATIGRAR